MALTGIGWDLLVLIGMALALLIVPLGAPGLWVIVGLGALGWFFGMLGPLAVLAMAAVAGAAELLELLIVRRMNLHYGGSRRAFWCALAGGLVGVVLGVPIPILGSVIGGIVGTFAGAAIGAYSETLELAGSARVGWGTALGRVLAIGVKMGAGAVMIGVAAFALW
ncbi:MAG: DUF456 family protein [Longimicrobiales bacterium]